MLECRGQTARGGLGECTTVTTSHTQLSRASFHLETRNPSELAGIDAAWDHFCSQFQSALTVHNLWTDSVLNLGKRVAVAANTFRSKFLQLLRQTVMPPWLTVITRP